MIVTCRIKNLPNMNDFLKKLNNAEEYNLLSQALAMFFNSQTLTKKDYQQIVSVLLEKLPILTFVKNANLYRETAVKYATFNYPENEDIARVISDFIVEVQNLSPMLLEDVLFILNKKLAECSEFVGVEVLTKTIGNTVTQESFLSICKIVGIKK